MKKSNNCLNGYQRQVFQAVLRHLHNQEIENNLKLCEATR